MARVIDVATENVRIPVARDRVARTADLVLREERVNNAMLSITFVTEREISRLNWRHLRHRGATDVISFGFDNPAPGSPRIGDVYVCPAVARRNALAHGEPVRRELLRLIVHGVLHVLGQDHPEGDARYTSSMWRQQEKLLTRAMKLA